MQGIWRGYVVMLVGLQAGCGASSGPSQHPHEEGQSYHHAIEMMCQVDRLADLSVDADPIQIGAQRAEWIAEHVEHPDAIEFRTLITVRPPGEQAKLLKQQAKSVGLEDCPLADSWEAEAVHGETSRIPTLPSSAESLRSNPAACQRRMERA